MIKSISGKQLLRPLPLLVGAIVLITAALGSLILITHMDIPTLIASFSTNKVTVTELQQGKFKPIILIDVRSPEEYSEDRIAESILVPIEDIESGFGVKQILEITRANKASLTPPTLVLYCASGPRSIRAYKQLEATGLKFVVLTGGIQEWRRSIPASQDAEILLPLMLPVRAE